MTETSRKAIKTGLTNRNIATLERRLEALRGDTAFELQVAGERLYMAAGIDASVAQAQEGCFMSSICGFAGAPMKISVSPLKERIFFYGISYLFELMHLRLHQLCFRQRLLRLRLLQLLVIL